MTNVQSKLVARWLQQIAATNIETAKALARMSDDALWLIYIHTGDEVISYIEEAAE